MRTAGLLVLVSIAGAAIPAIALAHPEIDRARALVEEGSFEEAARVFDEAFARTDLTREDLVLAYEGLALLHHAQRDEAALERALLALASIAPTHRFGARHPPDLAAHSVAVGQRIRGHLRVSVSFGPSPAGTRLSARADDDPAALVRELRVRTFDAMSGQWTVAQPPVEAAPGRTILAMVEAIGPGGAVLAAAGSPDAPLRIAGPGAETAEAAPVAPPLGIETPPPAAAGNDDWVWGLVIGLGAAVLIGGGIAVGVYLSENPNIDYHPTVPIER